MNRRYYAGIALNEAGLGFHKAGFLINALESKTASATLPNGDVNTLYPENWKEKPSIKTMRRAHGLDPSPEEIAELVAMGVTQF
jgi:hypothetical protein